VTTTQRTNEVFQKAWARVGDDPHRDTGRYLRHVMYIIVCRRAAPGRGRQELLPVRRTSHSSVIHQPGGRGQVSARARGGRPARVIGWKGSVHLHGSTRLLGCPSADQTYLPFHSSIHPCPLFLPNLLANPSFSSSHSTSPHPPDHRSYTDKQTTAPILSSRTTARTAPSATPVRQIGTEASKVQTSQRGVHRRPFPSETR
jgi:hypothetical protein